MGRAILWNLISSPFGGTVFPVNPKRPSVLGIKASVAEKAGPGHFLGLTVQPIIEMHGYELIIGSSVDPQFGPALLFGAGGQLVEVFQDRALAPPPLNTTLARRMIEQTRIAAALKGVRGRKAIDMTALERFQKKQARTRAGSPARLPAPLLCPSS